MIKFSSYNRIKRYIKRHAFAFLFGNGFKKFGKKVSMINPDIIEGEQYICLSDNVSFGAQAWLLALKQDNQEPKLVIEEGVTVGRFSHIVAIKEVVIEKNVLIADKVYISDNLHSYEDINTPIINQKILFKSNVIIGENSWIGENVCIIGAKIGKHSVIGSNSVVNSDIPDYSIAVGSPARVIKKYDFKDKIWKKV